LFGILIGAFGLGGLADRFGRKVMFIVEMALFIFFLVLVTLSSDFTVLLICLLGMGIALGCDYPTAHLIISESISSSVRGRLVLSAFGFQAVGALAGTAVGLLILQSRESIADWRWMYATAIIPAVLVLLGRFFIPRSGHWLLIQGRMAEAEKEVQVLLRREPPYPKKVVLTDSHKEDSYRHGSERLGLASLFSDQPLDYPGGRALVSSGSRYLWDRDIHSDHSCRSDRRKECTRA
jgi:MFS transporter, putative metabolite transport protein